MKPQRGWMLVVIILPPTASSCSNREAAIDSFDRSLAGRSWTGSRTRTRWAMTCWTATTMRTASSSRWP